jgi:hypothetical protein
MDDGPMETKRTEIFAVRLTPSEKDRLRQTAEELGLSSAALTRLAFRKALPSLFKSIRAVKPAD